MIKIFSVVRTSLSILRVKAGSLQQLLKSSTVDFLLNLTEILAKFVHFVIVIFLEDTSLNFNERPLTEEQFMNNRASWDGGIVPHPRPRRLQSSLNTLYVLLTVLHNTLSFPQVQHVTSIHT